LRHPKKETNGLCGARLELANAQILAASLSNLLGARLPVSRCGALHHHDDGRLSSGRPDYRAVHGDNGGGACGEQGDRHYDAQTGNVKSIHDFVSKYLLLSYALDAYGLGDRINTHRPHHHGVGRAIRAGRPLRLRSIVGKGASSVPSRMRSRRRPATMSNSG
jgi:hypothetical protein